MSSKYYIATCAIVDGDNILKSDVIINYFKSLKNAKMLVQFHGMMNAITYPSVLSEHEMNQFLSLKNNSSSVLNYFKADTNSIMQHKLAGFMLRTNCSEEFCRNITGKAISEFEFTNTMSSLKDILNPIFKPVIIAVKVSKKSRSDKRMASFKNVSDDEFDLVQYNKLKQCRKMNKFDVHSINNKYQFWAQRRIGGETDTTPINSVNLIELDSNYTPIDIQSIEIIVGETDTIEINSENVEVAPMETNSVNIVPIEMNMSTDYVPIANYSEIIDTNVRRTPMTVSFITTIETTSSLCNVNLRNFLETFIDTYVDSENEAYGSADFLKDH